jgi:hypothetical protein
MAVFLCVWSFREDQTIFKMVCLCKRFKVSASSQAELFNIGLDFERRRYGTVGTVGTVVGEEDQHR